MSPSSPRRPPLASARRQYAIAPMPARADAETRATFIERAMLIFASIARSMNVALVSASALAGIGAIAYWRRADASGGRRGDEGDIPRTCDAGEDQHARGGKASHSAAQHR